MSIWTHFHLNSSVSYSIVRTYNSHHGRCVSKIGPKLIIFRPSMEAMILADRRVLGIVGKIQISMQLTTTSMNLSLIC